MVMDVMQAASTLEKEGRSIIHMEVGQPGTPAPALARDAVARALEREPLGYTLALGNDALAIGSPAIIAKPTVSPLRVSGSS